MQIDKSTTIVTVYGLQLSQTVLFVMKEIFSFSFAWRKIQIRIRIFGQLECQVIRFPAHIIPVPRTKEPNNQTTEESKNQRTEEPNSTEREKNDRCFGVNAVAPYASDLVFGFGAGLGIHGGVGVAIPLVLVNLD